MPAKENPPPSPHTGFLERHRRGSVTPAPSDRGVLISLLVRGAPPGENRIDRGGFVRPEPTRRSRRAAVRRHARASDQKKEPRRRRPGRKGTGARASEVGGLRVPPRGIAAKVPSGRIVRPRCRQQCVDRDQCRRRGRSHTTRAFGLTAVEFVAGARRGEFLKYRRRKSRRPTSRRGVVYSTSRS